jgi:hypothetical protein
MVFPLVKVSKELLALLLLLALGLAPRLAFVARFPTIPISDFLAMVLFGLYLRDHGLISNYWYWMFNPGVPLILCGLFQVFPSAEPASVARLATATACGLLPILPFLIWRGVLPFWLRLLAGAALALWPGQITFSGVVAPDNWVLLPTVALGALAVKAFLSGKPTRLPAAGLLFGAAALLRQEIPVALFPLFLLATGASFRMRWRRVLTISLAGILPLSAVAAYRYAATGRFALSQESAGLTILGSYIPGAADNGGWIDPTAYIASVRPDLLRDPKAMYAQSKQLALQEALRRPGFHAVRMLSTVLREATEGEVRTLFWSLGSEVMPEALRGRANAFARHIFLPLEVELGVIQALFLAALIIGIRGRNRAIVMLTAAVLLKYGVHAVTAAHQGRYFLPATALEILGIFVAVHEFRARPDWRWLAGALSAGLVFACGLMVLAPRLDALVQDHDLPFLLTNSFTRHLAVGKPAKQSSIYPDRTTGAMRAVDGSTDGNFLHGSVTATTLEANAWWEVDLGRSTPMGSVVIWNRTDCCMERLNDFWVFVSDSPFRANEIPAALASRAGTWGNHQTAAPAPSVRIPTPGVRGRYVRVQLSGTNYLSLAEVQVLGVGK